MKKCQCLKKCFKEKMCSLQCIGCMCVWVGGGATTLVCLAVTNCQGVEGKSSVTSLPQPLNLKYSPAFIYFLQSFSVYTQNSCSSGSPLTSLTDTTDIGDLINEAMEDLPNPDNQQTAKTRTNSERRRSGSSGSSRTHSGQKQKGGRVTQAQSKSKMEIHVASDKSVVLDFCSDSSDDDNDVGYNGRVSQHGVSGVRSGRVRVGAGEGCGKVERGRERLLSPPAKSGKLSGSDHGSIFSESDDDFCFVDTPTSTKVVSVLVLG